MKHDIKKYTYRIEWSEEDQAHIARCLEFPSLAAHGKTPEKALKEIETVVAASVSWISKRKKELSLNRLERATTREISHCAFHLMFTGHWRSFQRNRVYQSTSLFFPGCSIFNSE